jgi:N-formylglutamate deformylase
MNVQEGNCPLLISVPHAGTLIPAEIKERMAPEALFLPDTDWFVDKLYGWATVLGATLISTPWSRYLVDLNRPSDDSPLYDQPGTSLVPDTTFCGHPIYRDGEKPGAEEVEKRVNLYWRPYHELLTELLAAMKERHGYAILLDGHSIRSKLPGLFEGELPELNLGTNEGKSAARGLCDRAWQVLEASSFEAVRDARFTGGYITRNYGRPEEGVHAVQLEIAQRAYMQEFPPHWESARAEKLIDVLKAFVGELEAWTPDDANGS